MLDGLNMHMSLKPTAGIVDKRAPCFRLNLPVFCTCVHVSVGCLKVSSMSFKYCFEKKCNAKMSAKLLFRIESRPITNSNGLSSLIAGLHRVPFAVCRLDSDAFFESVIT